MNDGPRSALDQHLGPRSLEEVLSTSAARVILGGKEYLLPDLPHKANKRWLDSIDGYFVSVLGALAGAGKDLAKSLSILQGSPDSLLDLIYSYDLGVGPDGKPTRAGVLPPREEIEEQATDRELLLASMKVWQAANPTPAIAVVGAVAGMLSDQHARTRSSQPSSATATTTSRSN